ncbi:aspartate--tRNA ligase [candidate division KSB1 bacterium]|nr:aspartate--tRNA ligase [candidate division KSB1 bacterium]
MEALEGWKRTHTCGELTVSDEGGTVILMGWVDRRRDHGALIFIDLRDRDGMTQIVFDAQANSDINQKAKQLRGEYVIAVRGKVIKRPAEMVNPNLKTGAIEIAAEELKILNESLTAPFPIADLIDTSEENRLRYRYLDLRRPEMQQNLRFRHRLSHLTRDFFTRQQFIEVETPYLMKSTPEGARDYLVPSRNYKGRFYALPQSPQTYKQLLMVAGIDRYFQIVRCFRDEDLRADRQPEFTQIDIEMSFIEPADIYALIEQFMAEVFHEFLKNELTLPLLKMRYAEAMARFGTDRPDTRFNMEIREITEVAKNSSFKVFQQVIEAGGCLCGLNLKGGGKYSRKQMDELNRYIMEQGGKGLVQIKVAAAGWESSLSKFFTPEQIAAINRVFEAEPGDLLLIVGDVWEKAHLLLGALRLKLARAENLIDEKKFNLLWIVDFPLLEYSEEEQRYVARHHPFTAPMDADLSLLAEKPEQVRAKAYDLVLNGTEIAGGSIRIHQRELQQQIFRVLRIADEEAEQKFGFLMNALQYGAPPHGGIAFGFDRLTMILAGRNSIRDVIAFPKTASALSLMDNAPSTVDPRQLQELGLSITVTTKEP